MTEKNALWPILPKFLPILALAAILALAGYLRFHNLESRQPRISDEADYIMEAQWISSLTHAVLDSLATYREERQTGADIWKKQEQFGKIKDSVQGHAPYLGRPGHVLLVALTMQFGMVPELAGAWESAVFGILTVLLLFFFARHFYGTGIGLLSSFFLAISAYHVWYSRTGFAEADTTFFLLLTAYLYVLATEKNRLPLFFLTGLSAGIGFVVHHRFLLFFLFICLFEVFRFFRERRTGKTGNLLAPLPIMIFCFAMPALLLEFVYHVALIAFQALGKPLPCPTYFSQLFVVFNYIRYNNLIPYAHFFTWNNFLTFPYLFWYMEGPLFCFLMIGGIVTLLKRHQHPERITAVFFLVPLLFYSYKNANARFACATLPFAVLSMALFVRACTGWARNRGVFVRTIAVGALGCILVVQTGIGWSRIQRNDGMESDWREAMEHLRRTGDLKNINVYPHMSKLYLGEDCTAIPPGTRLELEQLYEKGFQSLVLVGFMDYYVDRFDFPEMRKRLPSIGSLLDARRVTREVGEKIEPDFQFPCDFCNSPLNILEINLNFEKSLAFIRKGEENKYNKINIYDLEKLFVSEG